MSNVPTNLTDIDFLQEGLSFSNITPVEFENLVFHLLDEMGFSNIEWRKGGEGNSATDGGRDLEATFWNMQPAGASEQKYWFEVKFRTGQLEKTQVKETLLNAAGSKNKDFVVIVTNSTISNPTQDWVKEFQEDHKIPIAFVWQGHELERLLRRNLRTLARFLPLSLSFLGRCKVLESRFLNLMALPAGDELAELWQHRDVYADNDVLTLGAIISESAYGNLVDRPWGMALEKERLFSVAAIGMINIYSFVSKCETFDREQANIIDGMAYLIQCILVRIGAEKASSILFSPEEYFDIDYVLPTKLVVNRYEPIYRTLFHDLAEHCSAQSCLKLSHIGGHRHRSSGYSYSEKSYFAKFRENDSQTSNATNDSFLVMNSKERDCNLGLVAKTDLCPLGEVDEQFPSTLAELKEKMKFARSVLLSRVGKEEQETKT